MRKQWQVDRNSTLHSSTNIVECRAVSSVQCILFSVKCAVCIVHFGEFRAHCALFNVRRAVLSAHYIAVL